MARVAARTERRCPPPPSRSAQGTINSPRPWRISADTPLWGLIMIEAAGEGMCATASPLTSQVFHDLPPMHRASFSVRHPHQQRPSARRWRLHPRGVRVWTQRFTGCDTSGYKRPVATVCRLDANTLPREERYRCPQSLTSMTWWRWPRPWESTSVPRRPSRSGHTSWNRGKRSSPSCRRGCRRP